MGIRKPALSVGEARRLASIRSGAARKPGEAVKATEPNLSTASEKRAKTADIANGNSKTPVAASFRPAVYSQSPLYKQGIKAANQNPAVYLDKVQVFLSAGLPAQGVSATFDLVSTRYPPRKALQMILRRALHEYDALLETGEFVSLIDSYQTDETHCPPLIIQTSRMMPRNLLTTARAHFDPLSLETTRAFGRKLATAALAAFFARELKR